MKKKKRGIEIKIKLSNRWLYTLIAIGILAIIGVGVYAYAGNVGHTSDQIDEVDPTVIASVKDGIAWNEIANRPAGLDNGDDDTQCDTSGTCSQVCIGTNCISNWPSGGDPDWITPNFGPGWSSYTGDLEVYYRKLSSGMLMLTGRAQRSTSGDGLIMTLPVGYRPARRHKFVIPNSFISGVGPTKVDISVYPDGRVIWEWSASGRSVNTGELSSVHFLAEQ